MLKRLQAAGSLSAKVQRPDYAALIYKGGTLTIEATVSGYFLKYESPEGFGHQAKAWAVSQEDEMQAYLLTLADEGRWKKPG